HGNRAVPSELEGLTAVCGMEGRDDRRPIAHRKRKKRRPVARAVLSAAGRQGKFRQRPTLPHGNRAVPSALEGLTAVFGMGTGGTPPIKPPESLGDSVGCQPVRWNDWRPIKPPETFAYAQATCRRRGTVPRSTLVLCNFG